jgi:hypothetical protein
MEDGNKYGPLSEARRHAVTRLRIGTVDWGDTEPSLTRMPAADPGSAVEHWCLLDTGADWCAVRPEVVEELGLTEFDAPSPTTLGRPPEEQEMRPGAIITVMVGGQPILAPAYTNLPEVRDELHDVLIGTYVLRHVRFTYDGLDGTYGFEPR